MDLWAAEHKRFSETNYGTSLAPNVPPVIFFSHDLFQYVEENEKNIICQVTDTNTLLPCCAGTVGEMTVGALFYACSLLKSGQPPSYTHPPPSMHIFIAIQTHAHPSDHLITHSPLLPFLIPLNLELFKADEIDFLIV